MELKLYTLYEVEKISSTIKKDEKKLFDVNVYIVSIQTNRTIHYLSCPSCMKKVNLESFCNSCNK